MASPTSKSGYLVRQGDTLESISRFFYGDTREWHRIARANGIKQDRIFAGTTLQIPPLNHVRLATHPASTPSAKKTVVPPTHPSPLVRTAPAPHVLLPAVQPPPPHRFENLIYRGDVPATCVAYPAVSREIKLQTIVTPQYIIEGSLGLEGGLQCKGVMTKLTMETSEKKVFFSGEVSADYDTAFSKMTSAANIKFDVDHPEKGLTFGCELSYTSKVGGKEFISTSMTPVPPNQFVFKMAPRELEAESPDQRYKIKGKISFIITVTLLDKKRKQEEPVTSPSFIPSLSKDKIIPVVLIGGTVIVLIGVTIFAPPAGAVGWAELLATLGVGARVVVQ